MIADLCLLWIVGARAAPAAEPAGEPTLVEAPPLVSAELAGDLRLLLQRTGATEAMRLAALSALDAQAAAHPDIPAAFWDGMREEVTTAAMEDVLVPVYAARFTPVEVRQLLLALDNPAVRKLLAEQDALAADAERAGAEWGAAAARRVRERIAPSRATPRGP